MTNPTPPQTPKPPAAGELSDEQLLQMAAVAVGYNSLANSPLTGFIGSVEAFRPELLTYARAAIAADRAQRPQAEQMAEALRRLWMWAGISHGWDAKVVADVGQWIDAGMTGDLPPLPERLAHEGRQLPPWSR